MADLQYPLGTLADSEFNELSARSCVDLLRTMPGKLENLLAVVTHEELHNPIRSGAWTPFQLVYHLADSHMNGYIRTMLALTEDNPVIKPYDQDEWVRKMPDDHELRDSIHLFSMVHERWCAVLDQITDADFERIYTHPEMPGKPQTLTDSMRNYAWHGAHHLAQIAQAINT